MTLLRIESHPYDPDCEYLKAGHCYWCCFQCNYNTHRCPGCGTDLDHNGNESNGTNHGDCID